MLSAGTPVGHYEVVSWLGAGGMGEVYRARDTKLHREVALKTLPEELSRQPERLARLRQEARILASLNHPGIATLYGLEEADGGVPVLVMELVEGESLADRLRRGPLPAREAMTVAQQIALALEAAHEKGVLHRDLKPGNIRLTADGCVKLLDFGLARAVRAVARDSRLDTETSPHSEPGAVLGTAPYMSPEQARGQEVDRRSDVWAFGCVLFELLTGKRAFEGATFSDTVAAVLNSEPDWQVLPGETPPSVLRLLRRCLQKEKGKRLRDIGDVRLELEEIPTGPASKAETPRAPRRHPLWPTIAVLSALLGGGAWWMIRRAPSVLEKVVRLPVEVSGEIGMRMVILVVAPTGERIAYGTLSGLVVRELDKSEGRLIPGTASAIGPFFSPDGDWLGFTDGDGILKKVKVSSTGGVPITLCKGIENSYGGTWGPNDSIIFTPDNYTGLWQVSAGGGEPRELTKPDHARGEKTHRWPQFLPGGKAVLFTVGTSRLATWDDARIEALVLRTGERRTILEGGTGAAYVESGHLLYRRGTSILAAPFDVDRLAVTGNSVAVVDGVQSPLVAGNRLFAVARTGLLAYVPQARDSERLVLVDRTGEARPLTPFLEFLNSARVSPDGGAIAVGRVAPNNQIWRFDIEREAFSQLTFEWDNINPVWTPDGESLIVSSTPGWRLRRVRADGSGTPEPLAGGEGYPHSVTPDGKLLAFLKPGTNTGVDIWIMPLEPGGAPRVFLQTPANEGFPAISPDGYFLAYQSDESGQDEVYLRSLPDGGSKIQVSTGGGRLPVWARNGKELFYYLPLEGSKRRMMVVDVSPGNPVRISRGRALFDKSFGYIYDVLPDGQHFAMVETDPDARITHFNVVLNWFEELKRLVPPK